MCATTVEVGIMSPNSPSDQLWSIILADGEGPRVNSLVHRWLGRPQSKQYCAFVGTRSMFQHTLDRATRLTTSDHIVTVVARSHRQEALAQLDGRPGSTILFQPTNRDTAAGMFLPLTYIRARAPQATVVHHPSNHFVYPEDRFLEAVRRAVRIAESRPDRLVMLGVAPDRLELDYGWIQPSQSITDPPGEPVQAVCSFLENPDAAQADAALRAGALWNTLVFAANVELLWALGWQCIPDMMPLFERLSQAIGGPGEGRVLDAIYQEMPAKNFSSDLLQRIPDKLAVIELSGVLWSDWGKPERIAESLRRINRRPAFPLSCLDDPFVPLSITVAQSGLPISV
jgi:mannose-1-phosphate guanylyltransferase